MGDICRNPTAWHTPAKKIEHRNIKNFCLSRTEKVLLLESTAVFLN
jgi:hypothetical protein